ncbi:MAG: hypothetical protein ACHBN1_34515 [Heteroscytonema crispum UTEX LB 1556]
MEAPPPVDKEVAAALLNAFPGRTWERAISKTRNEKRATTNYPSRLASRSWGKPPLGRAGEPTTNNAIALHQSPGSGKRHCDPWPDPKTAVAPLPRARSEPGGIFPTADASAPSPTTNN